MDYFLLKSFINDNKYKTGKYRGSVSKFQGHRHWVKSVRIRSYSGPYFPALGLNVERYGVSLRIQS